MDKMQKSVRLVTSTYGYENKAGWIENMFDPRNISVTIYRKNDKLKKGEENMLNERVTEIPNYGRCDYAFLYHILKNYDKLDDITIFSKINWEYNSIPMEFLLENVNDYDFIWIGNERKYTVWSEMTDKIREQIPDEICSHNIEIIYDGTHLFAECAIDWFREIFTNITTVCPVIKSFGHGPVFSVSKELIHRHPKEVYEKLLKKFYPEEGSWDIDFQKYGYSSLTSQMIDIGKHYHDNFYRFYPVLFTFQADSSFRILFT